MKFNSFAGQVHRELDLAEGRRGRVPASGRAGQEVRRSRRRHGIRRGGTGLTTLVHENVLLW